MRSAVSQFFTSRSLFLWRYLMCVVNDRSFEEDRAASSNSISSSENVDKFSTHILQTNEVRDLINGEIADWMRKLEKN